MAYQGSSAEVSPSTGVSPHISGDSRRLKRCYHRVISGLEKDSRCRFITLTSSLDSRNFIQQDLRRLIMRLRRQSVLTDYIRVIEKTKSDLEHVHLIYRGRYIPQPVLSRLWEEIHQAPIVDIRSVKPSRHHIRGAAAELAKYMAKEGCRRYSWSWGWVYKGFVGTWQKAKSLFRKITNYHPLPGYFLRFLELWHIHLTSRSPPSHFLGFLQRQLDIVTHAWYFPPATSHLSGQSA
ncbi:hypothetical protein ES703_44063 [subsurface metagenome]